MNIKDKSRYLSLLLRHKPEIENLKLDKEGWCSVAILLEKLKITQPNLDQIVNENNKQRFRYNDDKSMIKANQGHSIPVKDDYRIVYPPRFLYHGTSVANKKQIYKTGLKKMNRNHVHLSEDYKTAEQVGMRKAKYKNNLIIMKIDSQKMDQDGHTFFLSDNGVWLISYVPAKYIIK